MYAPQTWTVETRAPTHMRAGGRYNSGSSDTTVQGPSPLVQHELLPTPTQHETGGGVVFIVRGVRVLVYKKLGGRGFNW